jgi:ABC-type nitrate/sulfonate/bicarbonate transport system substrate-binding protein
MDKVNFPYRSDSHLPFLHVVHDSGSWAKHGLDVNYDYEITSEDSHKNVANGTVEFVGGNHLSPYIRRSMGDKWVYLGQSVSLLNHRLVVRADSGINKVSDLKGKKVATKGKHPGLNTWLFIKQAGLLHECEVEKAKGSKFHWEAVRDGEADAAFVTPPADILVETRRS